MQGELALLQIKKKLYVSIQSVGNVLYTNSIIITIPPCYMIFYIKSVHAKKSVLFLTSCRYLKMAHVTSFSKTKIMQAKKKIINISFSADPLYFL